MNSLDAVFFASPREFRRWMEKHHRSAKELLVGFHKVHTGKPSLTWPQSVDVALCFGWIDGVRRSLGAESYTIRFTPRKASSIWSNINTRRVAVLVEEGLMTPAGLAAFALRDPKRAGVYSFEANGAMPALDAQEEKSFRARRKAWAFFEAQPPGYRRIALRWVTGAKRAETRARRLATLVADSANGKRLDVVTKYQPARRKSP